MDQVAINASIKEPLSVARRSTGGAIHLIRLSFKYCNVMRLPYAKLAAVQAGINGLESLERRAMAAKHQLQAAARFHQPCSQVHQLLHYGFYPTALGGMTHGSFPGNKPELPYGAQDVIGQSSKSEDQCIGGELARREPFHVHVVFDLGVKLLARAVVGVEPDHLFFGQIQCSPPSFDFDLGRDKTLSAPIDGALHRPQYPFEPVGLTFIDLLDMINSYQYLNAH